MREAEKYLYDQQLSLYLINRKTKKKKKNVSASVVPNNPSMALWIQVTLSGSLLSATNCTLVQLSLMVHHSNMSWCILNNPEKQIPESWFPFGEKIQYSPIWLLQTQLTACLITIISLLTSASFISWSLILMIMKLRADGAVMNDFSHWNPATEQNLGQFLSHYFIPQCFEHTYMLKVTSCVHFQLYIHHFQLYPSSFAWFTVQMRLYLSYTWLWCSPQVILYLKPAVLAPLTSSSSLWSDWLPRKPCAWIFLSQEELP